MTMIATAPPPLPLVPPDFEARSIDTARREVDDIYHCADAEYQIRWIADPIGRKMPGLIIVFAAAVKGGHPACRIALAAISQSTGALTLLEGDKLRAHVRRSVEHYLHACEIVLDKPEILFSHELN